MSKSTILKGTLILTAAGLMTRIIGFFYRVYLSNMLGAEKLGLYQLVFPIYGICFTLYAGGFQTAISKLVAAEHGRPASSLARKKILKTGLLCSLSIALCLSFLLLRHGDSIAASIIGEPSCSASLRLLAFAFPFCGVTACINGYYYGLKKAGIPASTQLLEQIVRVASVFLLASYFGRGSRQVTCELAILGVVFGEIASCLYNIVSLSAAKIPKGKPAGDSSLKPLLRLSAPLMGNRLLINLLHSFEAILIPGMLRKSGLTSQEALALYGVLTGMSIPFILFPSTITNALATFLLPTVSEANASHNDRLINHTASLSVKYSLIVGIFSTGIFMLFGNALGEIFFHNKTAGQFLVTLSWLCPFMYLTTTLGSIINGLGKTHLTFINTVTGLAIRILFVLYLVPNQGITGYLTGLLVSELSIGLLDCMAIYRHVHLSFDAVNWLVKPALIFSFLGFLAKKSYVFLSSVTSIHRLVLLLFFCLILLILFVLFLFVTKTVDKNEFR